jgi:hypothetical protein
MRFSVYVGIICGTWHLGQPSEDFYVILTPLFLTIATKVDGPNSVTYLSLTPIFEWSVVRCESKNGHQKDTCLEEGGLSMSTILSSVTNIFKRACMTIDHLISKRIFTLVVNKILSKLHNTNLLNVTPSLISRNPREHMFSIIITHLVIIMFLTYISWILTLK